MNSPFLTADVILVLFCALLLIVLLCVVMHNVYRHAKEQKEYKRNAQFKNWNVIAREFERASNNQTTQDYTNVDLARLALRRQNRDINTTQQPQPQPNWSAATSYDKGDEVSLYGRTYVAKGSTLNNSPDRTPQAWKQNQNNI